MVETEHMATRSMTYAELAEVWGVSKDAARKKVEGLRLPRSTGNDGRARVMIDLAEVSHTPKQSKVETAGTPAGAPPIPPAVDQMETVESPSGEVALLLERVAELRADLQREREERERERERAERLTTELTAALRSVAQISQDGAAREREAQEQLVQAAADVAKAEAAINMIESVRDGLEAELMAYRLRPWWKRLAG